MLLICFSAAIIYSSLLLLQDNECHVGSLLPHALHNVPHLLDGIEGTALRWEVLSHEVMILEVGVQDHRVVHFRLSMTTIVALSQHFSFSHRINGRKVYTVLLLC
jgi:hypothetical protein